MFYTKVSLSEQDHNNNYHNHDYFKVKQIRRFFKFFNKKSVILGLFPLVLLGLVLFRCFFIVLCWDSFFDHEFLVKQNDRIQNSTNFYDHEFDSLISRPTYNVSCFLLFTKNQTELNRVKNYLQTLRESSPDQEIPLLPDSNFIFDKKKCKTFKNLRGYTNYESLVDESELNFPLAFTILLYKNVEQFERFLKAIYRPQNIYCIHIDTKSDREVYEAVKSIIDCFENVFIATKLENVVYASVNRLNADLNCMKDLLNLNKLVNKVKHPNLIGKKVVKWKYLLNTASTEFPLRTNSELVQILKTYNGSNDMEIIKNESIAERYKQKWFFSHDSSEPFTLHEPHTPPPFGLKIFKSSAFFAMTKKFVYYAMYSKVANDLLKWSNDTYSPDEL
jgi:hypothetical protein